MWLSATCAVFQSASMCLASKVYPLCDLISSDNNFIFLNKNQDFLSGNICAFMFIEMWQY